MSESASTVLVVDDDADIRSTLREVLTSAGYRVEVARDGAQGLARLLELAPEVALVDVQMPGLSGTELLARLANEDVTTRVVMMTAFASRETEATVLEHAAHAFLTKPFELEVVLAAVSSAARVARLEKETRRVLAAQRDREQALQVAVEAAGQRIAQLDALHSLTALAGDSLDFEEVRARSADLVARYFRGQAEVRLLDEATGQLSPTEGLPQPAADEVARAAIERRTVVCRRAGPDDQLMAAVSLEARGCLLAVLCVSAPGTLESAAHDLLPRLGATLAMALSNALLFRRAQEALERTRDTQQRQVESERLAVIGQMTAGLAHELNTPVSYLLANLHVLKRGLAALPSNETTAEWQSMVDDCTEGAERIRRTVKDLRLFGRGGADSLQSTDLNALVDSVLGLMRAELVRSARLERHTGSLPTIDGHPGRLAQALLQLLRNAVQAVEFTQGDRLVEVTTGMVSGRALVRIRDRGVGMSPQVLARAFEPFFSTRPAGQGVGLGLSMAMDVVRHHGGELRLTSRPGEGSTVEVLLPVREATSVSKTAPGPRRRILVIDEDRTVLQAVSRLIGRRHEVVTAQGGRQALELLGDDDAFDLILCDLNMPDLSGPDVFDELARSRPELLPRFAVLTGGALDERQEALVDRLGSRVLDKPFEQAALESLLSSAPGVNGQSALKVSSAL